MNQILIEEVQATIKDAAKKLTGWQKRDFIAKVAEDYLGGSARKTERLFGWKRTAVDTGLHERRTGIICIDNYRARGRHKSEKSIPNLETDIRSLLAEECQADPQMKSTFAYTRITAKAVREKLIIEKGYDGEQIVTGV